AEVIAALPVAAAQVAIIRAAAAFAGEVIEVIVICPQVPQDENDDDGNQDHKCRKAEHDLGHLTIQRTRPEGGAGRSARPSTRASPGIASTLVVPEADRLSTDSLGPLQPVSCDSTDYAAVSRGVRLNQETRRLLLRRRHLLPGAPAPTVSLPRAIASAAMACHASFSPIPVGSCSFALSA